MSNALQSYLEGLPDGPITEVQNLEKLLASSWNTFSGSNDGGMQPQKILGRLEKVYWNYPILTFYIERHGAIVKGSTRGEVQVWEIDISQQTASLTFKQVRQLNKISERINIQRIATEIAECMQNNISSSALKRFEDGSVKVFINVLIPSNGFKQTVSSRRKRFREELEKLLSAKGWHNIGLTKDYTYISSTSSNTTDL